MRRYKDYSLKKIPKSLYDEFRIICINLGVPMAVVLKEYIRQFVKTNKGKL